MNVVLVDFSVPRASSTFKFHMRCSNSQPTSNKRVRLKFRYKAVGSPGAKLLPNEVAAIQHSIDDLLLLGDLFKHKIIRIETKFRSVLRSDLKTSVRNAFSYAWKYVAFRSLLGRWFDC